MAIAAAQVEHGAREREVGVEAGLRRPQQGAEGGQVAQMSPEQVVHSTHNSRSNSASYSAAVRPVLHRSAISSLGRT